MRMRHGVNPLSLGETWLLVEILLIHAQHPERYIANQNVNQANCLVSDWDEINIDIDMDLTSSRPKTISETDADVDHRGIRAVTSS